MPSIADTWPSGKNAELPEDIVGAVCVIRHDNKMVMVSEVITRKIALPGGYIDTGDTAPQAAAREALEEAGIVVKVKDLLQYRDSAAIFSCVAESPILVSSFRDHTGHPIVASWFSKHFSTEVQRVYLIVPDDIAPEDYRYPVDTELFGDWLARTPESPIQVYTDLSGEVNSLHRYELQLIQAFQQSVKALPASFQQIFAGIMYVVNFPGEPAFIVLAVLIAAGFCGPRALLQLTLALLLAIFATSLLKLWVASPRPSYIIPELQQVNAYGFGFPSTHTFLATIVWGSCWYKLCRRSGSVIKWLSLLVFVLLIIGQAVSRVWYGVHFITDTMASIMLALTVMTIGAAWCANSEVSLQSCVGNKWLWLLLTLVVGTTASFTLYPVHVYICAILLGGLLGLEFLSGSVTSVSFSKRLMATVIIGTGLAVIGFSVEFIADQLTVSLIVLSVRALGCFLAAFWLVAGTSFCHQRLASWHKSGQRL